MLTLAQIKLHCRIDGDAENALLESMGLAAHEYLCLLTGRKWYAPETAIDDPTGLHITPLARQAMLLMIGAWYENREADWAANAKNQIPSAVYNLLQPYRIYGV